MARILIIRKNLDVAAEWCRKYGFPHDQVGDELRISGLLTQKKPSWLEKFRKDTGCYDGTHC